jgi:hypothetical protein
MPHTSPPALVHARRASRALYLSVPRSMFHAAVQIWDTSARHSPMCVAVASACIACFWEPSYYILLLTAEGGLELACV